MKPDQGIVIRLVDTAGARLKLPGVILTVMFSLNGKHRFGFRTEPSNSDGVLVVSCENLEQARMRNLAVQPLDFKTLLEDCDETVRVVLPSQEELLKAADTLETMGQGRWKDIARSWRDAPNGRLKARDLVGAARNPMSEYDLVCEVALP